MHMRIGSSVWIATSSLIAIQVGYTSSFTLGPTVTRISHCVHRRSCLLSSIGDTNDGRSPAQRKQEQIMEMASIAGAKNIASLEIHERTKRAMLAENVEDRIFELVDELEILVKKSGGLENLSDETKEEAVEIAKQTKELQIQYDDLVSGRPSSLLSSILDLDGSKSEE